MVILTSALIGTLGNSATPALPVEGGFPSLRGATSWLNSPPLSAESLRGKVVLVDFWTYTCINWLRTLPHVRAWAKKYSAQGLVVIGVHTPEFEFEQEFANVQRAVGDMQVSYPVAVDSDRAIWRAFDNQYWPAIYLIDVKGNIRHHQFGEGEYAQTEGIIQQLLAEAGAIGVSGELVSVHASGAEVAADWNSLKSEENYLGYERTQNFVARERRAAGRSQYSVPARLALNSWSVAGDWTIRNQSIAANKSNGRIVYRFQARDLHLVMGPATHGAAIRFRVRIDGEVPGAAHGADIDVDGNGIVTEQRLYQLIRQHRPIVDRLFEIEFLDAGLEAFAFTFG